MNLNSIEDIYPVSARQAAWLRGDFIGAAQCVRELRGALQMDVLEAAWRQLVTGHPWLRGSFVWRRVEQPLLLIQRETPVNIQLQETHDDEVNQDFDPATAPLWRLAVQKDSVGGFRVRLTYSSLLLDAASAQLLLAELARGYEELRQGREFNPRGELPCQWNDMATDYPSEQTIGELFETQAALTPDAIAVCYDDAKLSYAELNRCANQLAHHLRRLGVGAETCVGVCLEQSAELIVALLATLKAGGAYLPLNPAQPLERLAFMLTDARAPILITREAELENLPAHWGQVICLDSDGEAIARESADNPATIITAENLAYINYTSGSTGQPKGICIPHRAVVRLVRQTNYIQISAADVIAQAATPSFDAATFEIWGALLNGAQLAGLAKEVLLAPQSLAEQLRERRISVLFLTTALFNQLAQLSPEAFRSLRCLLFGGEAAAPRWVRAALERGAPAQLLHVYGPTESTTFASWHEVQQVAAAAATVPIGRPLANTELHLLDTQLQPVPAGVAGELYIGGDGLARAYLNQPDLTAERFIPHPFSRAAGARLYKTGDRARYDANGEIEFLGRLDRQVKLRGFRIELEEIEAALRANAAVRDVVVDLRADAPDEKQLVAYVVPATPGEWNDGELRRCLRRKLPDYMLPAAFVRLEQLPVTPNGKLDRRALPAPDAAQPAPALVAPATPTEQALADVWAAVLDREAIGVTDNFFEAGGDSIRSLQVIAQAQARGLTISIQEIFQHQTIRELAQALAAKPCAPIPQQPCRAPFSLLPEEDRRRAQADALVDDAYPLTRLQAGMLFHSDYQPDEALYLDVLSYHLRGPFDAEACRAALQELTDRHGVLRTAFDLAGYSEPVQLVQRRVAAHLEVTDLSDLSGQEQEHRLAAWVEREKQRPFDWRQAPLIRFALHRRGAEQFQFSFCFHHAILDGWSEAQMLREFFDLYFARLGATAPSPHAPLPLTYADFVALERAAAAAPEQRTFWRAQLHDAPLTTLPSGRATTQTEASSRQGRLRTTTLPAEIARGLKTTADEIGVPLKSVLLAAHLKVLGLFSGETDVVTGLVTNGRPEAEGGERLLGLFLNTVPLRVELRDGSWAELACAVAEAEQQMLPFRRVPLAEIQRVSGRTALYEAVFNFIHFHAFAGVLESQQIELLGGRSFTETNFPFIANFNLDPATATLQLLLHYDAARLPDELMEAMGGYYLRALTALAANSAAPHHTVDLLSAAERKQLLVEANATTQHFAQEVCLPALFEQQAANTPEAIAVESEDELLSYQTLNAQANQISHLLRARGVAAEITVGVCLPRSAQMAAAVLGILKAGGAYVPLDANWPPERLAFVLRDAGVKLLLTHEALAARLASLPIECLCLDEMTERLAQQPARNLAPQMRPGNLAYVIYTSGSTGQPKGVGVEHRQLLNYLHWFNQHLPQEPPLLPLITSLSFDASLKQLLAPLLRGARVWALPDDVAAEPEKLRRALCRKRGVGLNCVPALWEAVLETAGENELAALRHSLTHLFLGGEQLSRALIARTLERLPRVAITNLYGPTETTANASFARITSADEITIGGPLANTQLYILDAALNLAPVGVAGELHIGGAGVARAYLNQPALTAERFIPDPFSPGGRLYKTGDRARRSASGQIEFLGRNDNQVKVRGFRIELGEIESALREHPDVAECAVLARTQDGLDQARLVAYLVMRSDATLSPEALRRHAAGSLPDYMVPSGFVRLHCLPRNTHGKLDRRALLALDAPEPSPGAAFVAPRSATEVTLAEIWIAVLERERVGVHDNFFELGGHSLSAAQVVARIRAAFACELPLRSLFEAPTIAGLAERIDHLQTSAAESAELERMVAEIRQLPDHEIEQLLRAERAAGTGGAD